MRRLHLLISAAAMGCAAVASTQASAIGPSELPRMRIVTDVRIVCDAFDRCFRIGPYGRRVFVPRGAVGPGPYREGFDGPDRGFGPPPGRGFGEPRGRGFGDDDRERGARRDDGDRDQGEGRRQRRRDNDNDMRPDDGPGGRQGGGQAGGGRNRAGEGDGGQRQRGFGNEQNDANNGMQDGRNQRRPQGAKGQFGGGNQRFQQDDGEQ